MDRAQLRAEARAIFEAAVAAVEPETAVRRVLSVQGDVLHVDRGDAPALRIPLGARTVVLGAGKAAAPMARAVEDLLGDRVEGLVVVKHGHGLPLRRIAVREAGHPIPDEAGLGAARDLAARAGLLGPDDLAIVLLSGGGSALIADPVDGLTLRRLRRLTADLLRAGADIGELNTVRRRLSTLKGGGLARAVAPARLVTLALSDVLGDDPLAIASGPTVADPTTAADARRVLARYRLDDPDVVPLLADPPAGVPPSPYVIVGSLATALRAAGLEARRRGWPTEIADDRLTGEARNRGRWLGARLLGTPGPRCILAGGEPTVTVRGDGSGGRAQELAAAAADVLAGSDRVLLAAGTDGTDGPTDAAGAIVDGGSVGRAGRPPAEHLDRSDSGGWLEGAGDRLVTGPTRTNVNDLVVGLVPPVPASRQRNSG